MKIKVTKKHIKNGILSSHCNCPIALAIKEQTKHKNVSVLEDIACWNNDSDSEFHYNLSQRALQFIVKFDSNEKVRPQNFIFKKSNE